MAKLNREYIIGEYNKMCDLWGIATVLEDSDEMIDKFGKLAKAGITEEQLLSLLDSADAVYIGDFTDPKYVKAHTKKPSGGATKVVEKVVEPRIENLEVKVPELDPNQLIGAMGKAMASSLASEYAPLVAEAAVPIVEQFIKQLYDIKEQQVRIVVPDKGEKTAVFHEAFDEILTYVMGGDNVMLVGDAGTGKNVICEQIADLLELPFYFANKVSDEFQIKGFVDANGVFQETAFYRAMKCGGVFMLDEMDASDANAIEVLNSVLANHYLTFPNGEFVRAHNDFHVLAGCNTAGTGATYQYVGRNQLDASTLNRFIQVTVDYSPRIEESLTDDENLLKFVREFRTCCKDYGINHVVSYRNITMLDKYVDLVGIDKILRAGLLKNLEKDDLTMLLNRFERGWSGNRWAEALLRVMA